LLTVRRIVGGASIAAAVAIGVLTWRAMLDTRARAEQAARAQASQQAARTQAALRAVESKAQAAAEVPSLNAALSSRVDSATIIDLLDSEDWWQPYRGEFPLVRLIVGDKIVASRGTAGGVAVEAELLKTARRRMVASAPATIGGESFLLGAARFTALSENEPVLILGRPAPVPPAAGAPKTDGATNTFPWSVAGGFGLIGFGLLIPSGRRRKPLPDLAADIPIAPIEHETTLKFGERRAPANDLDDAHTGAVPVSDIPTATPGHTVVVGAPNPDPSAMFGRYRLIGRLGEGGMSELFIAEASGAEGFTRSFVLKRLRPELARDKNSVAQFIDEARLQSSLVHSNIVPVYDFGVVGREYFMTQEFIAGRDLGRLIERHVTGGRGALPTPVAYFAAHETLQALSYAHAKHGADDAPLGIVHRDIAPGNILISLAGEVKLSDFGIVKSNDRVSRTQIGIVKGNTNFMSPEQARGAAVDARSDLYSLALVLYYGLAGQILTQGLTDLEVLHRAANGLTPDDFTRIRRLADPAPQILERALALDPADRFQTAAEFADELAIHMGGGRAGAARLIRELFSRELTNQTALPAATAVGYTAGP
jgi:serine/threonine-protein kinase